MTTSIGPDVFVSYSRRDREKVLTVVEYLRQRGLSIWFDQASMSIGNRLREAILGAIANCSIVLIFVSRNSLKSRWVLNELDSAMTREIREQRAIVVPIALGQIRDDEFPGDIAGKYYIDLRHNFKRRWDHTQDQVHAQLTALLNGSASTGDTAVLRIGDSFIRFLAGYSFRHRYQTQRFDEHEMAQVARAIGTSALYPEYESEANEIADSAEHISDIELDTLLAQAVIDMDPHNGETSGKATDWGEIEQYTIEARRFVWRYGVFAVQQLVMFLLDRDEVEMDLTGGFRPTKFLDLINTVRLFMHVFSIYFKLEDAHQADERKILVYLSSNNMRLHLIG